MSKIDITKLNNKLKFLLFLSFSSVLIRSEFFSSLTLFLPFLYLGYLLFSNKLIINKIVFKDTIYICIPFFIVFVGLLFTDRFIEAIEFVLRSTPLLFIPFLFFRVEKDIILNIFDFIFKYFPPLPLILFYVYALVGLIFKINGYGDYLYYSNFSEIADIHTTYLGLIINLAVWFIIKRKEYYNKIWFYFYLLSFSPLLIIVSSKVSLLVYVILITYAIMMAFKQWRIKLIILILLPSLLLLLTSKAIVNRFLDEKIQENKALGGQQIIENIYNNDMLPRIILWESNIESLDRFRIIYGNGTKSNNSNRNIIYKKNNLENAYKNSYNAHNQFVEIIYSYGLWGILLFLIHNIFLLKLTFNKSISSDFVIYCCFIIYFMTESILFRTIGIVLYAFIISYIYINNNKLINEKG